MEGGFYMVYKDGKSTPAYMHPSYDSAKTEAERLVRLYGGKCYVLCAMTAVEKHPEFLHTQCGSFDLTIPF